MGRWARRIRGALGIGVGWGAAWFTAGMALMLAFPGAADVPFPVLWAALGFVGGVVFSLFLSLLEGRRSFDQMSLGRFATWGAMGGMVLAVGFTLLVAAFGETVPLQNLGLLAPIFGVAGAGSAAGSLALARRASDDRLLDVAEGPRRARLEGDRGR